MSGSNRKGTKDCKAAKTFLLYHKLHRTLWAWGEASCVHSQWWFSAAGDKYVTSIVIWILFPQSILKNDNPNVFHWPPPKPHQNKWSNNSTSHLEDFKITERLCSISKSSISDIKIILFIRSWSQEKIRLFSKALSTQQLSLISERDVVAEYIWRSRHFTLESQKTNVRHSFPKTLLWMTCQRHKTSYNRCEWGEN